MEMADEIDIEEHDIFSNPELRRIFPDISKLKQELDEEESMRNVGTHDLPESVMKEETDGKQPVSATYISHQNTCDTDENISENLSENIKHNRQDRITRFTFEKSNNTLNLVPKREILICKVCSKESEEEMCQECVLESAEECTWSNSLVDSDKATSHEMFRCSFCVNTFIERSDLQQHLLIHIRDTNGLCETLKRDSSNNLSSRKGNENKYTCYMCEYNTAKKSLFNIHILRHTGEKPLKCDVCDYRCYRSDDLKLHLKIKHMDIKNYECNKCEYKTGRRNNFYLHVQKHTNEKPYKCSLCDYRCNRNFSLMMHIKVIHEKKQKIIEKNYSCDTCGYTSNRKDILIVHIQRHTGEKPFSCNICNYKFTRNYHLKRHLKSKHTNEKNYACDICEYKCVRKDNLTNHLQIHAGDKQFSCYLCNEKFTQSINLKNHLSAKHRCLPLYSCDICAYKCVSRSYLNKHLLKHSGQKSNRYTNDKTYLCDICNYKAVTKQGISNHLRTHTDNIYKYKNQSKNHLKAECTNDKNYSCDICEHKFDRKSLLVQHLQKHTGEKPYQCDLCNYKCLRVSMLNDHIKRKHTNEKNYSCEICEYKSVTNSELIEHLRVHSGEKPYNCDLCDSKFSQSSNLKQHLKRKHTDKENYSFESITKSRLKRNLKYCGQKQYKCGLCDYKSVKENDLYIHLNTHADEKHVVASTTRVIKSNPVVVLNRLVVDCFVAKGTIKM